MELLSHIPTKIFLEKNAVAVNQNGFCRMGKKCLIVTGAASAKKCGALQDVENALKECAIAYQIYDKIAQNPTVSSCMEAGLIASRMGADFILGIGGGSPMDAAKAIAVIAANPDISETDLYALAWKNTPLPIGVVGTTAGTGSEVTPVAVITNSKGLKKSLRADTLYPTYAWGDAKYTYSLPEQFTRSTGADAMAHCLESYFNRKATVESRTAALKGLRLAVEVFEKGMDFSAETREKLYLASIYGGMAISVTGTAFPHAVGYFLSENHGIAHGTACAVFLPSFIRHQCQAEPSLGTALEQTIGCTAEQLIALIEKVTPVVSITLSSEERKALYPPWVGNKSIEKSLGTVTPDWIDALLCTLFGI